MEREFLVASRRLFCAALLALTLLAASPAAGDTSAAAAPPQRILSLSCAATHILLSLGRAPAAIDEYGRIATGGQLLPVVGRGSMLSQERLVELQIDCVLLWSYQTDVGEWCRQHGLRAEVIPPLRLQQVPALIARLGALTDAVETATALVAEFTAALAALDKTPHRRAAPPVAVYLELYAPGKAAGDETYVGDLIRAAGGRSVVRRSGLVSLEAVLENAPEVIFYLAGHGDAAAIQAQPGLRNTPAVRHGRVYPVERRLIVEGLAPLEAIAFFQQHLK
jgi:iron complex transport system substrate-binding protein